MASRPDNDLLRPSLEDRTLPPAGRERPWRLGSQVYVAFFGGPVAVTGIALLNAGRLRLRSTTSVLIAVCGLAGLIATVVLAASVEDLPTYGRRAIALVAWGGMWWAQRFADRAYGFHARDEEPYASLWIPGAVAVVLGNIVLLLLVGAAGGSPG